MRLRKQGGFSDSDDEPLALWHAHMLLMLHHLIHHHLLHTHVPVHHVLMLLHLLRRHLGVVAAHLIPAHHLTVTHHVATAHHLTVTHHVTALHAPSAAPHHSAATHSVHHEHTLLHHGLVLLHQFLTLCRVASFLNLAHLLLHFFQVFFATVSLSAHTAPIKDLTKDGQYVIMDNIGINLNIPSIPTITAVTT